MSYLISLYSNLSEGNARNQVIHCAGLNHKEQSGKVGKWESGKAFKKKEREK